MSNRIGKSWKRTRRAATVAADWTVRAVDEVIYALAPQWGARRKATRASWARANRRAAVFDTAWKGADHDRFNANRWLGSRLSPDSELEEDLDTLRERCSELYRTNEIAHGAVEGRVIHEVGTGITPQGRVRYDDGIHDEPTAKRINQVLEEVAKRWSDFGCDRTGQHSLPVVQRLVVRTYANLGEVFILLADRGSASRPIPLILDVIDPLRVETPDDYPDGWNVRLGVRYSESGEVLGYFVRRSHPYDTVEQEAGSDYYPRFDATGQPRMLHVFEPLFPGQTRGLPWLAAAITRLKDAGDVVDYTIIAMQLEACFSAFVKPGQAGISPHDVARGTSTGTDGAGNRLEEIRPGAIEYLNYGEEIDFSKPERPGGTFTPFLEFALHSIAACVNYPYELLAGNFLQSSFSSGRLAMMAGRMGMAMRRHTLIEKFLQPVWRRIVFESILVGELDGLVDLAVYSARPHVYERHVWHCTRGILHINPAQEAKARETDLANDTTTLATIYAEDGQDWEDSHRQRGIEKAAKVQQEVELAILRRRLEDQYGLEPGASQPGLGLPLLVEQPDTVDAVDE